MNPLRWLAVAAAILVISPQICASSGRKAPVVGRLRVESTDAGEPKRVLLETDRRGVEIEYSIKLDKRGRELAALDGERVAVNGTLARQGEKGTQARPLTVKSFSRVFEGVVTLRSEENDEESVPSLFLVSFPGEVDGDRAMRLVLDPTSVGMTREIHGRRAEVIGQYQQNEGENWFRVESHRCVLRGEVTYPVPEPEETREVEEVMPPAGTDPPDKDNPGEKPNDEEKPKEGEKPKEEEKPKEGEKPPEGEKPKEKPGDAGTGGGTGGGDTGSGGTGSGGTGSGDTGSGDTGSGGATGAPLQWSQARSSDDEAPPRRTPDPPEPLSPVFVSYDTGETISLDSNPILEEVLKKFVDTPIEVKAAFSEVDGSPTLRLIGFRRGYSGNLRLDRSDDPQAAWLVFDLEEPRKVLHITLDARGRQLVETCAWKSVFLTGRVARRNGQEWITVRSFTVVE